MQLENHVFVFLFLPCAGRVWPSPSHESSRPSSESHFHFRRKTVCICFLFLSPAIFLFSFDSILNTNLFLIFLFVFVLFFYLQRLFFSCKCRWSDAACALPSRCTDRPGHPTSRSPDQHTEPRGGGVCSHNQQPHTSRLHRWQRLCQDLGHQPTRQQEPSLPAWLLGQ